MTLPNFIWLAKSDYYYSNCPLNSYGKFEYIATFKCLDQLNFNLSYTHWHIETLESSQSSTKCSQPDLISRGITPNFPLISNLIPYNIAPERERERQRRSITNSQHVAVSSARKLRKTKVTQRNIAARYKTDRDLRYRP